MLAKATSNATKELFAEATNSLLSRIKPVARLTLTLDNGVEMNDFEVIESVSGITTYFADPYSSWQRGTNENTNGLIRQYIPKGSDFSKVTEATLDTIVEEINNRPRKRLKYGTPLEVFCEFLIEQ